MSSEKPRVDVACGKCGSVEWEMEADTEESVTYKVDFGHYVFAETARETAMLLPTDWYCLKCKEPADTDTFDRLGEEFVDEKSGRSWQLVEEDEWDDDDYGGGQDRESYSDTQDRESYSVDEHDGPHDECGVNLPHSHGT